MERQSFTPYQVNKLKILVKNYVIFLSLIYNKSYIYYE